MSNNNRIANTLALLALIISVIFFVITHKWNTDIRKQDKDLEKKEKKEKSQKDNQEQLDEDIFSIVKYGGGDLSQPNINRLASKLKEADRNTRTSVLFNLLESNLSKKNYADIFKKVNFSRISISDIPLSQLQCFDEIHFSDINLSSSSLKEIDFSGIPVDFQRANLESCKFDGSSLCNSSFKDANLVSADFTEADLSFSDFSNADLRECSFDGALLFGIKLNNARVSSPTWITDLYTIYSKEAKGIKYLEARYEINPNNGDSEQGYLISEKHDWKIFPPHDIVTEHSYTTYSNQLMGVELLIDNDLFNNLPFGEANINKKKGRGSILFVSHTGDAVIRVESQNFYSSDINCLKKLTPSKYDQIKETLKTHNTGKGIVVKSGFLGSQSEYIYYEKFIISKNSNKYIHFQLIHPTIDKKNYEKTTLYLEKTFNTI